MPNLANKVAVVTGGTSGVRCEVAKALANHNATVYIIARDKQKSNKVVPNIKM
ncbi:SDR family NAD(P)-dependent oxidoreductase [Pediococcus claussenii]|uniref:SDR family NAD(P)-dependent oxidoreductase n=1 Tax=Pediococcus claussenii TaxID=187452 RepID=UPI0011D2BFE3